MYVMKDNEGSIFLCLYEKTYCSLQTLYRRVFISDPFNSGAVINILFHNYLQK